MTIRASEHERGEKPPAERQEGFFSELATLLDACSAAVSPFDAELSATLHKGAKRSRELVSQVHDISAAASPLLDRARAIMRAAKPIIEVLKRGEPVPR